MECIAVTRLNTVETKYGRAFISYFADAQVIDVVGPYLLSACRFLIVWTDSLTWDDKHAI